MYGELALIKTTQGAEIPAVPIVIQNPPKVAALRLPSAEEIAAYTGSIRVVTVNLGRRQTEERTLPNPEAERRLFEAMRLDKHGEEFDEAEVRYAIDLVLRSTATGCEREGDQYVIRVATLWGITVHHCRMPTVRELQDYREGLIKSRGMQYGAEERKFPPEVPMRFYDAIIRGVEGYAPQFNVPAGTNNGSGSHLVEGAELKAVLPQIPPHHKRQVATEVSTAFYELDPQLDPSA